MPLASTILFALMLAAPQAAAQPKEIPVHHAHGSFTVDVHPLTPAPAEGIGRFTINKTIRGDLLASEALEILNSSKITALIVTDTSKPVGIVHLHDILRAGVA